MIFFLNFILKLNAFVQHSPQSLIFGINFPYLITFKYLSLQSSGQPSSYLIFSNFFFWGGHSYFHIFPGALSAVYEYGMRLLDIWCSWNMEKYTKVKTLTQKDRKAFKLFPWNIFMCRFLLCMCFSCQVCVTEVNLSLQ